MRSPLAFIKKVSRPRNRSATALARANDSLAATVQEEAETIAQLVVERDRFKRFWREAQSANVDAWIDMLRLKAELALKDQLLASRLTQIEELERELGETRQSLDDGINRVRMRLLPREGHA